MENSKCDAGARAGRVMRTAAKNMLRALVAACGLTLACAQANASGAGGAKLASEFKPPPAPDLGTRHKPVQLALNWKPEPQFGGFYAAELGGHFKKHGLSVEILPGGAGTPVVQMVAAGKTDFGIVSADEIVISRARGGDVVALFATYHTNPQAIMVHSEKGHGSLKDVFADASMTIALQKGLPYAIHLQGKFAPVKARIVPYQGGITGFQADKSFAQQCFLTAEPLTARRLGLKPKVFMVADEGYNPYTTVLAARAAFVRANPKLVADMVAAVRAGWRDYLRDPGPTNQGMHALNPSMDLSTFAASAEAQKPLIEVGSDKSVASSSDANTRAGSKLGTMTGERWRTLVDQLFAMKVIASKPDYSSLFHTLPSVDPK